MSTICYMDGKPCTPEDQEKCGIGCHNGPVDEVVESDDRPRRSKDMSELKQFQMAMSGKRREFDDEDVAADDWVVL